MHRKLLAAASFVLASASSLAAPFVWTMNNNTQLLQVNPITNNELLFGSTFPMQSDSLARDPSGNLYISDPGGVIRTAIGLIPVGNTGFTQIADLSYSSGGLWGFSNASDSLFFFDLSSNTVTYSQAISGLAGFDITGVTQDQTSGDIYLSGNTGLNMDSLFVLDLNTATANVVGSMTHADAFSYISDIEFTASGSLLAMTWFHRDFYTVNPFTAATTFVSAGPHRDVNGLAVDTSSFPQQAGVPEAGTLAGGAILALLALARKRSLKARTH